MKNSDSTSPSWKVPFFSGMACACVSTLLLTPFDVGRTRMALLGLSAVNKNYYSGFFKTFKKIYTDEGFKGLYAGISYTLIGSTIFVSVFFTLYEKGKHFCKNELNFPKHSILTPMISSVSAGIFCEIITNPIWMLRTRVQSRFLHEKEGRIIAKRNLLQTIKKIYKTDGLKGFYRGFFSSCTGISHLGLYFPLYEFLQRELYEFSGKMRNWHILVSSLVSKVISLLIVYPFYVIRARLHDSYLKITFLKRHIDENKEINFRQVCKRIINKEGVTGFYAGIKFEMTRISIHNAMNFLIYENVKTFILESALNETL